MQYRKLLLLPTILVAAMAINSCGSEAENASADFVGYYNKGTEEYGLMSADGTFTPNPDLKWAPGYVVNGMCAAGEEGYGHDGDEPKKTGSYHLYSVNSSGEMHEIMDGLTACGYLVDDRIPTTSMASGRIIVRDHEGTPKFRLDSIGGQSVRRCRSYYRYGLLTFELNNKTMGAVDRDGHLVVAPIRGNNKVNEIVVGEKGIALVLDNDSIVVTDREGNEKFSMANDSDVLTMRGDSLICYRSLGNEGVIGYVAYSLSGEQLAISSTNLNAVTEQYTLIDRYIPGDFDDYDEEDDFYSPPEPTTDTTNMVMHYRYTSYNNDVYFLRRYLRLAEAPFNPARLLKAWNQLMADSAKAEELTRVDPNWEPIYHVYPTQDFRGKPTKPASGEADGTEANQYVDPEDELPGITTDDNTRALITNCFTLKPIQVDGVPVWSNDNSSCYLLLSNGKSVAGSWRTPLVGGFIIKDSTTGHASNRKLCAMDDDGNVTTILDVNDGGVFNEGVIPVARNGQFELLDKDLNTVLTIFSIDNLPVTFIGRVMLGGKIPVFSTSYGKRPGAVGRMAFIDIQGNRVSPWYDDIYVYDMKRALNGNWAVCQGKMPYVNIVAYDNQDNFLYSSGRKSLSHDLFDFNIYPDHIAVSSGDTRNGLGFVHYNYFDGREVPYRKFRFRQTPDCKNISTDVLRDFLAYGTESIYDVDWAYENVYHSSSPYTDIYNIDNTPITLRGY